MRPVKPSGMEAIDLKTRDGVCPTYVFRPAQTPAPGVLVYMDGVGIRPAMIEIAEKLAERGYFAVLPDLFYRSGPYEPMDPNTVFSDPDQRKTLMEKFFVHATTSNIMSDTRAFLDYLRSQPSVVTGGVGTTGYCFGGFLSLTAAGTYPDEIVAAASFHGGRLATDSPESPHLLASRMKARVYVAGATEDALFPDDMKVRLDDALTSAGVDHVIETYPAKHGWVLRDTAVYDAVCRDRHWYALLDLFSTTLPREH